DDLDPAAVPTERLVHGVVDDLPDAVHQAATVGAADVHTRTLTHRLEALEDLEMVGGVVLSGLARGCLLGGSGLLGGRHWWCFSWDIRVSMNTRPPGLPDAGNGPVRGLAAGYPGPTDSLDPATPEVTN